MNITITIGVVLILLLHVITTLKDSMDHVERVNLLLNVSNHVTLNMEEIMLEIKLEPLLVIQSHQMKNQL